MKENLVDNEESKRNDSILSDGLSSNKSSNKSDFSDRRKLLYIFSLGEVIAVLGVSIGEINNQLTETIQKPYATILSFLYYITVGLFWTIFNHGLVKPKFYYFLILFFDTQTNFFKFLAASVGDLYYPYIINSSSIILCVILSHIFIKKYKYTWKHFIACISCSIGTIISFYGAYNVNKDTKVDEDLDNKILGFIYSLVSALCFTLTIVFMEKYFSTGKDIYNFFPYLGIFGAVIVSIESFIYYMIYGVHPTNFETDLIHILYSLLFMVISLIFGTIVPFYIKRYSASVLNVFMISQIFWSYIFTLIFQGFYDVNICFYIGFAIILLATIWFCCIKLIPIPKKERTSTAALKQQINLLSPTEKTSQS